MHLKQSEFTESRYAVVTLLVPSLSGVHATAERILGKRDGVVCAIALELFHRTHGQYPASLDELLPLLLPQIPTDRITGEPVRYKIVDGKPLIYSVGVDQDDDGGRVPFGRDARPASWAASNWGVVPEKAADGDWVLYPQPEPEPLDE